MPTTFLIPPEQMEAYRRTARARRARERRRSALLRDHAWSVARQAARLLKEQYGATRVLAFGSLTHGAWFSPHSDIDLAAYGIPPDAFWRAWCALDRLGSLFEVDLLAGEAVSGKLRDEIARQGVEL